MRRHVCRAAARLATLALAATAGLAALAAPAQAATLVRECKANNISCISFSGYAGKSVWGFPVNASGNNCVNYAAYRLSRNGVPTVSGLGSGGSWAANARKKGFRVDTTPKVGAIAQWNYGSAYAPSQGHVGYVEEVTSSYIVISDSAWSGYSSRMQIPKGDRNWPSNFIHFRDQAYLPPPSGTFVKVRETGQVFRLVGRAPVFVSTWTAFGGAKPTHLVSSTTLAALPARPTDGTFLRAAPSGAAYRIAGGAPVYVATLATFGSGIKTTTVDQAAIDKAGTGGQWNHLLSTPAAGTFIRGKQTGAVYRMAGGAPLYVTRLAIFAGAPAPMTVDQRAIDKAGSSGVYRHLRWSPLDGTALRGKQSGSRYVTKAAVPVPAASTGSALEVDQVAIDHAGDKTAPHWMHLAAPTS